MKKRYNKKLLSAIAVLAITGTAAVGAATFAACNNKVNGSDLGGVKEIVGKTYYVSADAKADGNGESISSPMPIYTLLNSDTILQPGDTVYAIPGHYNWTTAWGNPNYNGYGIVITVDGKSNGNIKIINAAYDAKSGYTGSETKVTLDFSQMEFNGANRGVQIYGDFIYWYGIDICGAGDNGMYIGGNYNTVEFSEFYNNRDTGLQLGRSGDSVNSIDGWPSFNLIKNCTSHNNYDDETYGENADGFAAKLTVGYGNVFDGCIAYRNSDDGWDLYAKSDSGNIGCVILYNCVAFENGYLEYTQQEMHELLNYNNQFNEPNTNSYKTRDGDGNGFKLGGSVMVGDVKMYNCLSFQNRMHGVTDNSNPGYLKVEGVTSYDNSAAIDDDPASETFGQVVSIENSDGHGNIDVARQTYSYNTVKNVLSVKSNIAKSLDDDAYRGSVMNSMLNAGGKTNVIKGTIDADTKVKDAIQYTSQVNALSATDVFKQLPVVYENGTYTYNVSGLRDGDNAAKDTVHFKYRNEDGSINMGDILAVKDGFDFSSYLGAGVTAGSTLNKTKWEDYAHFADEDLIKKVDVEIYARLLKAKETLTINSDETAVYQDFEVPILLTGTRINWTTDSEYLTIGKKITHSISGSEYITVGVTRPASQDETATLTATINYLNRSITKTFVLNIKKDVPSIGKMTVKVTETDEVFADGGKIIMDAYRRFEEPVLEVENAAYYNGTLLTSSQYTVKTTYEYASSTKAAYVPVSGFMPNHPGVYRITHNVTLADGTDSSSMSYQIFVASTFAEIDFDGDASVSVYRDGYIVAGELTNVTGNLYTIASETELSDLSTAEDLIALDGVNKEPFRATNISFTFANENSKGYHIYYALSNVDGTEFSDLYHVEIGTVDINSASDFMTIAGGKQLSGEEISHTIYMLQGNLDFSSVTWSAGTDKFKGVFNGQGYTISNVTVNGASGAKNVGLFSQVEGGTIMNVKFDNIIIKGQDEVTGLVARSYGGYFHNIQITNILVTGAKQRVGGLIAQVYDGATPTEVSQVSIVNPIPKLTALGEIDTKAEENQGQLYYISADGNRAAGIIGFIQGNNPIKNSISIKVSDCFVQSYIKSTGYSVSSIVGEYNENGQKSIADLNGWTLDLTIVNCVSAGVLNSTGTGRIGGMLGYHNGAGSLTIYGCMSLQTTYYKNALLTAAQKNQSGTIGNFSSTGEVSITNCIALMEEYNTDYDVSVYSDYVLSYGKSLKDQGRDNWIDYIGMDIETKWSLVFETDEEGNVFEELVSPYVSLNFLGTWDHD